ncbi:unnamed protein product [Prorocentrum cordatum]|uniref:Uncharacterized protein n=1 Tax=Prorocentrum cordatum TaxID=2364126 RepID=A0ABN9QLF3_9DINO|nr:unnamed protein product [Polarella glacialis]
MRDPQDDPCAPWRGNGRRGVSRACYRAIWTSYCSTGFYVDRWRREDRVHLHGMTYEELVEDTVAWAHDKFSRCWPHKEGDLRCMYFATMLSWTTTLLYTGFLVGDIVGDTELVDAIDSAREHCPFVHLSCRLLLQKTPELFSNASRTLVASRRHHLGVPLDLLRRLPFAASGQRLLTDNRGLFGALRSASEAPFARHLRARGLSVDDCAQLGFRSPSCSAANASLLAAFYRHRDPGLPQDIMIRRLRAHPFGSPARVAGLLADADRLRNGGSSFGPELELALDEVRFLLVRGPHVEELLPGEGPPTHLVWHFLDKLALPAAVSVSVEPPPSASAPPFVPQLRMWVLPDHDVVSDYVRWRTSFHCPAAFTGLAGAVAAARSGPDELLRVVEVGGFLGDCLLWLAGWLGPESTRALEVEPVAAASARLLRSAADAGLSRAVHVVTEALGDGRSLHGGMATSGHGAPVANPNFRVRPASPAGGAGRRGRLRCLDEVLEEWPGLGPGRVVDLVRVKAAGSEALIVAGLSRHLAARRVRWLLTESEAAVGRQIEGLLAQWPHYQRSSRENQAHGVTGHGGGYVDVARGLGHDRRRAWRTHRALAHDGAPMRWKRIRFAHGVVLGAGHVRVHL